MYDGTHRIKTGLMWGKTGVQRDSNTGRNNFRDGRVRIFDQRNRPILSHVNRRDRGTSHYHRKKSITTSCKYRLDKIQGVSPFQRPTHRSINKIFIFSHFIKVTYYQRNMGKKMSEIIESNPEILGGKPVIKGTRIPVDLIFELIGAETPIEEILEDYPA